MLIQASILCVICFAAKAQEPQQKRNVEGKGMLVPNLHKKYIRINNFKTKIDSFSIIPQTFSVHGFSDSAYVLDYVNATILWKQKPTADSVFVTYRTFPFKLNAVVKRWNYDSIEGHFMVQPSTFKDDKNNDNFFNFGNITYNGSFGRALSFGNSQSAVVTSNLNLQLSGYLADSIQISAALTDNNIPIQPDGSTAQLSDFDKIFLQFKKKTWALSLGDIDLRQNQNYYLSFYKRLQGASFETTEQISRNISNKTLISGAIAKGKFARNIFQGQEGNQGPYRLQGSNNELYFVVLAGTEKVYIDGQMMQRGADQDYIINYNTAEIAFTPKRMITQDSRIQVEFEYSNQTYLNVNLYLYNETNFSNKLKMRLGVYSNSDARNSPINQSLDADQKKFLYSIGDSVNKAFYPVAPIDTLSSGKILYKKIDTTYIAANGFVSHDSVYIYSTDPNVILYNLSFVNVGAGNGDYVPNLNGVNGNVYQWVAPVNGKKQGQYEAAQFLVTPKTQRVITLGAEYNITKQTSLTTDLAASHYDVNTLSSLDKGSDNGYASRFILKNIHPFVSSKRGLQLTSVASYEYVNANFKTIEPFRTVEFTRDWGLPLQAQLQPQNETLYATSFELGDKKKDFVKYEFNSYNRGTGFHGIRNAISSNREINGWHFNNAVSLSNSNSDTARGYYFKPSIEVFKKFSKLGDYTLGASYLVEDNVLHNKLTDTISLTSFAYQTFQAYIKSPGQKHNNWGLTYAQRENYYPYGKQMAKGDRSNSVSLTAQFLKSKHEQFKISATYRDLQVLDTNVTGQKSDKSILARFEYFVNEWKGLLVGNVFYEVGSGQEQKKTFSYLEVPAGTGQYTWIDLNNDGIQELNEFVLAQFPDQAKFIRVYTPTNEFIKANYSTFNYSFAIMPKAVINRKESSGFLNFIARMALQSTLQLNQKQQASGLVQLNPFKKSSLTDTALITRNAIFSNTLSFNKASPKWGFDINNSQNANKSLLTYGYESRTLKEWTLRARVNVSRSLALNGTFKKGVNQLFSTSTDIDSSDYSLKQYSMEPGITYIQKSNLRILISYKFSSKANADEYGGQKYSANSINAEAKYSLLQNASVITKFTFSNISYNSGKSQANTSSPVSYIILDGLMPGKNYLWSIDFTKKLGGNLELGIQYEGRKPGEGHTINTGRASLRAIL
ncbi:MAG: hypothetical protein JST47_09635 [Bacteroidetes bacterium]|nr:hypothetical protein [Bacteroidota bacterium]